MTTAEVRWRAVYEDGSFLEEDGREGGAYAALDRARLRRFELYAGPLDLSPAFAVDVPEGSRLVYRLKRTWRAGVFAAAVAVAVESPDRSEVDLHVLADHPAGGTWIERRDHYDAAEGFAFAPPVLLAHEM
ncbi:MAG: hypothetical protein WD739_07400 [Actinomycetota bacterium]